MSLRVLLENEKDLIIDNARDHVTSKMKIIQNSYPEAKEYMNHLQKQMSCPHKVWEEVTVEGLGYYHDCVECGCYMGSDLFN